MRNTVAILGTPIDSLDTKQALERLEEFILSGRFHQVATANTDFLIKAIYDDELADILRKADLVVPDGMPVVAASRWLNTDLPERVTGADLVPMLAELSADKGYRIYMLGARPEVAAEAERRLKEKHPALQIVGRVSPPLSHIVAMDHETLLKHIEEVDPHILLVAFGNPKQEKWIYMNRERLKVPVCIGVGGTFDFIAGATKRAPTWMQRSGLEWIHRLSHEPKRLWKRYSQDLVHFSRGLIYQLWAVGKRADGLTHLSESRINDCAVITVRGPMIRSALPEFHSVADGAINAGYHAVVDFSHCPFIDSAALGSLINLHKRAAHVQRQIRLVTPHKSALKAIAAARAQGLFTRFETLPDALLGVNEDGVQCRTLVHEQNAMVVVRGELHWEHVPALRHAFIEAPKGVQQVDIDLRGVPFMDSAALHALKQGCDAFTSAGAYVQVCMGSELKRLLQREGVLSLFPVGAGTPTFGLQPINPSGGEPAVLDELPREIGQ